MVNNWNVLLIWVEGIIVCDCGDVLLCVIVILSVFVCDVKVVVVGVWMCDVVEVDDVLLRLWWLDDDGVGGDDVCVDVDDLDEWLCG